MKYLSQILFMLLLSGAVTAQVNNVRPTHTLPPVFHLTERDGLDSRYAASLVEDKQRGYIWIGTQSGIWRYDGETLIKVYPQKLAGGPSADTYLAITLFLADSNGDVWFFDDTKCVKRVMHTNGKIDTFYVNANGRNDPIEFYNTFYVGGMHQDRKGRIWANTTSHGLVFFDAKNNNFVPAPISHTLDHSGNTGKIYEDTEGWFWFANKLKPVRYNPETGEVWFDKNNPKQWPVFDLYASTFFVDSKQRMWLAEFSNGYRYDLKTQKVERLPELFHASGFVEDSLGYVWFGRYYNNFLTRYDPRTDTFERYYSNENDPHGLHIADWIAFVQMDSRGVLWALDVRNINAFNPVARQPFQVFKAEADGGATPLPKGEVSDVFRASDGRYYISYWMLDGGVVVLDSNFTLQEKWGWGHRKKDFHQKAGWNAIEDNEGHIWIAQQNGLLSIYDAKSQRLSKMICPEFKGTSPYLAMKDRSGNLWWGLWRSKGITKWDCRTKKFTNYPLIPDNHGLVYNIIEGDSSIFWLATEKGIIKFDHKTGKSLHNFLPPSSDSTNRFREVVVGLVKTNESTLVGGCTDGLFEFDLKTETYQLLQLNNGDKASLCMSPMMLDSTGNIYYGYVGGIVRFHTATRRISNIPLNETIGFPFQPRFFTSPLPNRRLAFSANDRFVILNIAALENEAPVPVPKVTLFMVDGDTTTVGHDIEQPIRLRHNENYFSLNFSSFAQPDQAIYYSYRLKGLKDEWSQPTTTPNARFTNVPSGEYTFEVRAQLANGTPTRASAFRFEVLPPYWQTWWFRLLAMAALAILIRFVFRYRLRQQLEKEAIRQRIARDLHDEVGSTLTTISILSESVLRNVELDGEKARLSGIGEKARSAMSSMSDIVWAVNPQNDSMEKVVERMTHFASETLENAGISPVIDIEKEVFNLVLPMEKRKDFYLFFKEATTNVAKHSRASKAVFSMKKENGHLVFELRDDGVGLPEGQKDGLGGNGLRNMRARAAALGADFSMGNGEKQGFFVRLRLPLT
jgi:signal transduction histidine kinase/ligand-binding sensor domain-containing protein